MKLIVFELLERSLEDMFLYIWRGLATAQNRILKIALIKLSFQ